MNKIYQSDDSSCFRACLASVLEMQLTEVPDFVNDFSDDTWFLECYKWLSTKGLGIAEFMFEDCECGKAKCAISTGQVFIGILKSRTGINHAVICKLMSEKQLEIIHDPLGNPSKFSTKDIHSFAFITKSFEVL